MNRENIADKDIVQFLEYHNRPDWLGMYATIKEGCYPIYKLNLEEHQLWLMMSDFFMTYQIDRKDFNSDTAFFCSAIKKRCADRIKHILLGDMRAGKVMTVAFLAATARRGVWVEVTDNKDMHASGQESAA